MRKILFSCLLLLQCFSVIGQEKYNYRYWFDVNDHKSIDGISLSKEWHINVDVSDLDDALHVFNIQMQDSAGVWSSPMSKYFYKKNTNDYFVKYWFDGDISTAEDLCEKGATYIDVSHLKDGLHSISSVVKGTGAWSNVETRYFLKLPQTVGVDYMTCFSFIDDKAYKQEKVSANGGVLNWSIDVENLSQGLHKLQVFVVTQSGVTSSIANGFFLRVPTQTELTTLKCYYTIDGEINEGKNDKFIQAGTYSNDIYHFDLDVANLTDGLHILSYMLIGDDGIVTSSKSSFFLKIPVGGNAITKWEYWTNRNDSLVHTTTLEVPKNPMQIVSLLPVESSAIRSSCYEFRVEDKKPVLYAKNDVNFRFYDKAGRITEVSEQYVDENVRQELKPDEIKVLQSNVATRVNRPAENEIKWYKFEAEEGDSLALNADKACTIDIFSPTGKPIYTASGTESVNPSGIHLYETGTFYVGVHDMTAKYGNEINLNFQLIDKYAVLSQDVRKVGNGGISTISFNGNGYLYLDSITIDNGNTIIKDFDIKYKSNTEIEATFDFNGAELGKYDITLHFVDDKLTLSNALLVETAKEITLASNVTFDTQFLRGTSSEYTVTVTNNGNMTAYKVPIYVYVETPLTERIPPIKMNGFDLPGVLDGVDLSEFSQNDINYLQEKVAEIRDGLHFNKFKTISKETGDSILVQSNYFFVEIPPYTTKTYTIVINSDEAISCYVTTPEEWLALRIKEGCASRSNIRTLNNTSDWYCCYKDRVECVGNIIVMGLDIANMLTNVLPGTPTGTIVSIADCVAGIVNKVISAVGTEMCGDGSVEKDFMTKLSNVVNSISIGQTIVGCAANFIPASDIVNLINCTNVAIDIKTAIVPVYDCYTAFTEKKPNCPPDPPGGGVSTPVNSLDPNDIRGYVAESGSKFIGKDVKTVNYMIEFENDSTFATASAHKIELIDTLDVNTLDISSIVPKKIKLGEYEYSFKDNNNGVATIDLRPNINAIAQVAVNVSKNGVLNCEIISLDPMTMEPTDDIMAGILPVNDSEGRGQGYFTFNIGLKEGMADGTEISNKSDIIFDSNEPISTPYWINETDYVDPMSKIDTIECVSDTIVNLRFSGEDNRSGIWRYTLYVQPGDGSDWFLAKENIEADSCEYKVYPEINYGFCVVATDSAGNVEPKLLKREISYTGFTKGDANGDGVIDAQDVVLAISKYLGEEPKMNSVAADVVRDGVIDAQDVVGIQNLYLQSNVNLYSVKRQRRTIKKE